MKRNVIVVLMLSLALLSACGKEEVNEVKVQLEESKEVVKAIEPTELTKEEIKEEVKKEVALNDDEQLALDYFNLFLNTDNLDERKQYFDDHIHEDTKSVFSLTLAITFEEDEKFLNPQFVSSADYKADGVVNGKVVLFTSGEKEAVVLINNSKFGWVFYSTDSNKDGFDNLRKLIK